MALINQNMLPLGSWERTPEGFAKLKSDTSSYKPKQILPTPIASSAPSGPITSPINTNRSITPTNNESGDGNNISGTAAPVNIYDDPSSSGSLSGLEDWAVEQNLLGTGQLTGNLLNTVGLDPNAPYAKYADQLVNKGLGTVSPGFGGIAESIINPKVVEAPWGDKVTLGAPGTLSGWIGQKNYDQLVDAYNKSQAGVEGYGFYQDVDGQPVAYAPDIFGQGTTVIGTLPEGVGTKAELEAYLDTQAANKQAAQQFIDNEGIAQNDDGSFTYTDANNDGILGDTYTTNITDSTGKPSLPPTWQDSGSNDDGNNNDISSHDDYGANTDYGNEDPYSEGDWDTSDSGGGDSGGGGTYCCTASVKQKVMTNKELYALHKWHHNQSDWWINGYDVWGQIIAKNLVSKYKYFAHLTKAFYDWKINKKFSWKALQAAVIIYPGVIAVGLFKRGTLCLNSKTI